MAEIYLRKGSEVYQARLKVRGDIVRVSTGCRNPDEARKEAERREKELNESALLPNDMLLVDAADKLFMGAHREVPFSPKTIEGYKTSLTNIVGVLGNEPLRLLDQARVNHYISSRLRSHGHHVQLRRDLAFLSSVLTRAKRWDCGVTSNPVREVDKSDIRDARKRKGNLKPHEFEKLLSVCRQPSHRLFVILGAYTGMRHQEILKLSWDELHMKSRMIYLPADRTKNREAREIPMHDRVFDTLSHTPSARRVGYVFKGKKEGHAENNFGSRFRAIRKRAGMPKVRIHDLRHTFASWLLQSGVPGKTAQELMGHSTSSMTDRYSHDSAVSLHRAVAKIDLDTLSGTRSSDEKALV